MERIKCALLGFGYWGKIIKKYIDADPRLELRYILDRHINPLLKKEEILDVDAVFICLPSSLHYEFAKYFIQNGINVFCEKPLTLSYLETNELITLAKKEEVVLYTDYPFLFSPSVNFIREKVSSLGKINFIKFNFGQFGAFYCGEDVLDTIGPHPFSLLFHLFPSLANLEIHDSLVINRGARGEILRCFVNFELGGVRGNLEMSLLSASKQRNFTIYCENGYLSFSMSGDYTARIIKYPSEKTNDRLEKIERSFRESDNLAASIEEFIVQISSPTDTNRNLTLAIATSIKTLRESFKRNTIAKRVRNEI